MKMKTIFFCMTLCMSVFFSITLRAQNIYVSGVLYNKQQEQGVIAEYNFPEDIVKEAVKKNLAKYDVKEDKSKGFMLYRGVRINAISPDKIDLYVLVEEADKKAGTKTLVKMLVSKGYDNFIKEGPDYQVFENIKSFLLALQPPIAALQLQQQIEAQDAELKKAEKKRDALKDDIADLQKKMARLQAELDAKNNELLAEHTVVEKEAVKLQMLREKTQ